MTDSRSIFSVSQINEYVRMTVESSAPLQSVFIRGEISNFKNQYSTGHLYFSLKDRDGMIKAVMFRGYAQKLKFAPRDGDKVIIHGKISVYVARGEYQVYVDDMQPDGVGALALAFERLKEKLSAEGLFDPAHKKVIPPSPRRVGVITSASGAAIHDILNVSGRRAPSIEIVIYPAIVQGDNAPRSLIGGIRYFNRESHVDVIIIGRGGGSIEDLWGFNDEGLAREIFASEIPVVSAVGHETDFTISDFVSDLRAPTPSAAAEIVFPNNLENIRRLNAIKDTAEGLLSRRLNSIRLQMSLLGSKLEKASPVYRLRDRTMKVSMLAERLETLGEKRLEGKRAQIRLCAARLVSQNPMAVLSKGYTFVESGDGRIISSASDLAAGERIDLVFADGRVCATVDAVKTKNKEAAYGREKENDL